MACPSGPITMKMASCILTPCSPVHGFHFCEESSAGGGSEDHSQDFALALCGKSRRMGIFRYEGGISRASLLFRGANRFSLSKVQRDVLVRERMNRFLRWLFPDHYAEVAQCRWCGSVVSKSRMVHVPLYGWFCNEQEADEFWLLMQW